MMLRQETAGSYIHDNLCTAKFHTSLHERGFLKFWFSTNQTSRVQCFET